MVAELIKCNDLQEQILSSAVKQVAKQEGLKSQKVKVIEVTESSTQDPDEESEVENISVKATIEDATQTNSDVTVKTKLGNSLLLDGSINLTFLYVFIYKIWSLNFKLGRPYT